MKKLLSLVLAIMMLLTVVSASAELDTSEQVEIIVYMMGDKPQDCDMVMEKVNEILLEKLNCTMSMKFVGWADWATAYNLLLTGGDVNINTVAEMKDLCDYLGMDSVEYLGNVDFSDAKQSSYK